MRMKRVVPWVMLVLLVGCAQLGLEPATSDVEKLAYAYSQNAAIRRSAAEAFRAGALSKADAQQVLIVTDHAREALDDATRFLGVDLASFNGKLQFAVATLSAAKDFLAKKGVK